MNLHRVSEAEYYAYLQAYPVTKLAQSLTSINHSAVTIWDTTTGKPWHQSVVARCLPDITTSNHHKKQYLILDEVRI